MTWNEFVEELRDNVDSDEIGDEAVTLQGILTYAGILKIAGAEKHFKILTGGKP